MYSEEYSGIGAEFSFPRALSVSEINEFIKRIFDGVPQFSDLYIQGEISNFKDHYSTGHFYFTLKDESSAIKAVMFRTYASRVRFVPENGMKVTVHGRISTYPRDGQYQIYCDSMEPLGIGALYAAFEQLKKKLSAEGLFDAEHKRPLPTYPERIGVVTSATGAAVRDIINVTRRRYPIAEVIVYPALVQGGGASESVARGIRYFNEGKRADVIIIGRGGGSIEDLWAFNDERLARVIYDSSIPVISAVGHETDFTISDFVADMRAPTPSAAAEIAVPDLEELKSRVRSLSLRQSNAVYSIINNFAALVERYKKTRVLSDPMAFVEDKILLLASLSDRLGASFDRTLSDKRNKIAAFSGVLNSLSPLSVLARGYSTVNGGDGKIIKSISQIKKGDAVRVTLCDGWFDTEVTEINGGNSDER